jgi:hypothetical protein
MEIDETAFDEPEFEPREETPPPPPTPPLREPSPVDVKPFVNGTSVDSDSGGEEGAKSDPSSPSDSKKAKKRKKKSKDKDKSREKDKKREKEKHRESKEERKKRKLDKSPESSKSSEKSSPAAGKSDRKLVECDMFAASSSAVDTRPSKKKHKHEKRERSPKLVKTERGVKVERDVEQEVSKPLLLPKLDEMLPDISPDYTPSSKRLPPLPSVIDSPASSAGLPVAVNGGAKSVVPNHMTENEALCWAMSNKTKK